jgi:hypothetical protein
MVEYDAGAPGEGLLGKRRMTGGEAGELDGVAGLALLVGDRAKIMARALMFFMADRAVHLLRRGIVLPVAQGRQDEAGGDVARRFHRGDRRGEALELFRRQGMGAEGGVPNSVAIEAKAAVGRDMVRAHQPSDGRSIETGMAVGAFRLAGSVAKTKGAGGHDIVTPTT